MLGWFNSWRERRKLKQLIRTMGSRLRKRYGAQEFYTPGQVLKTCETFSANEDAQNNSVAMYVEPKLAEGILSKLNKSEAANDLRKYLIIRCFDSFSDGEEDNPNYNPFMHPSSHGDFSPSIFSSGGETSGGWEGGHGGGDSGHTGMSN